MSEHDVNLADAAKAVNEINKAFEEFKAKNDERLSEIEKKGSEDYVTKDQVQRIDEEITKLSEVANQAVLAQKRAERLAEDQSRDVDFEAKVAKWGISSAKSFKSGAGKEGMTLEEMTEYKRLQREYIMGGTDGLEPAEVKALSVGGDPQGGYVVTPDMSGRIIDRAFDTSPMRAYATVVTTSSSEYEGLIDVDEVSFGWVGEKAARPETSTPDLGMYKIPLMEMFAEPKATQRILDDAEIDMEAWLEGKISERFGRAESTAFVAGNGVIMPRGFLTYPAAADNTVFERGALRRFKTGVNGDFAAAPGAGDVLIQVTANLRPRYRGNATWFMNRFTEGAVRQFKDSDGAYLWMPGVAAGQPNTLLGYPVGVFDDMPNIATGSLSMAFGDMRQAYTVVDRAGIRLLRDPYTVKPNVLFYATKRTGGDVVDYDALSLVEFAA